MKVALIGCGAIGTEVARAVKRGEVDSSIVCVYDKDGERSRYISKLVSVDVAEDIDDVLRSEAEIVIEAASQEAVIDYAIPVLSAGKDLIILSGGALLDEELLSRMREVARKKGCNIYLPSGAILGIDGINAASLSDVRKIKLTTRKSPSSLGLKVKGRKKILSARAKEAVKLFPKNINVAASVALSSGKDIRVEIIAEPGIDKNIHELFIETSLGNFLVKVENLPSAENPKSSLLAAKSVVALLKKLEEPIKVGT